MASSLWGRLGLWTKISIPNLNSVGDAFSWIDGLQKDKKTKKILKVLVIALLKAIWWSRNELIFKKKEAVKDRVLPNFQEMTFFWIFNRGHVLSIDWMSWLFNPF